MATRNGFKQWLQENADIEEDDIEQVTQKLRDEGITKLRHFYPLERFKADLTGFHLKKYVGYRLIDALERNHDYDGSEHFETKRIHDRHQRNINPRNVETIRKPRHKKPLNNKDASGCEVPSSGARLGLASNVSSEEVTVKWQEIAQFVDPDDGSAHPGCSHTTGGYGDTLSCSDDRLQDEPVPVVQKERSGTADLIIPTRDLRNEQTNVCSQWTESRGTYMQPSERYSSGCASGSIIQIPRPQVLQSRASVSVCSTVKGPNNHQSEPRASCSRSVHDSHESSMQQIQPRASCRVSAKDSRESIMQQIQLPASCPVSVKDRHESSMQQIQPRNFGCVIAPPCSQDPSMQPLTLQPVMNFSENTPNAEASNMEIEENIDTNYIGGSDDEGATPGCSDISVDNLYKKETHRAHAQSRDESELKGQVRMSGRIQTSTSDALRQNQQTTASENPKERRRRKDRERKRQSYEEEKKRRANPEFRKEQQEKWAATRRKTRAKRKNRFGKFVTSATQTSTQDGNGITQDWAHRPGSSTEPALSTNPPLAQVGPPSTNQPLAQVRPPSTNPPLALVRPQGQDVDMDTDRFQLPLNGLVPQPSSLNIGYPTLPPSSHKLAGRGGYFSGMTPPAHTYNGMNAPRTPTSRQFTDLTPVIHKPTARGSTDDILLLQSDNSLPQTMANTPQHPSIHDVPGVPFNEHSIQPLYSAILSGYQLLNSLEPSPVLDAAANQEHLPEQVATTSQTDPGVHESASLCTPGRPARGRDLGPVNQGDTTGHHIQSSSSMAEQNKPTVLTRNISVSEHTTCLGQDLTSSNSHTTPTDSDEEINVTGDVDQVVTRANCSHPPVNGTKEPRHLWEREAGITIWSACWLAIEDRAELLYVAHTGTWRDGDREVRLVTVAGDTQSLQMDISGIKPRDVASSADGGTVVVTDRDASSWTLYSRESPRVYARQKTRRLNGRPWAVCCTDGGVVILVYKGYDSTLRRYEVADGRLVWRRSVPYSRGLTADRAGRLFVSGGDTVRVYGPRGDPLTSYNRPSDLSLIRALCADTSSRRVLAGHVDGEVSLWCDGEVSGRRLTGTPAGGVVLDLALYRDKYLAECTDGEGLRMYDVEGLLM